MAILIIEFTRRRHEESLTVEEAAMEAARIRLRPLQMTAFAFIFGVLPLVLASGTGLAARRSLGTVVFGGMISAIVLSLVPCGALRGHRNAAGTGLATSNKSS